MPPFSEPISKTGYVRNYRLTIAETPTSDETKFYFIVNISDQVGRDINIVEFRLCRDRSSSIDKVGQEYRAVPYSSAHMGVIATLKDALIHKKKVTVDGLTLFLHPTSQERYNLLRSVTLSQ